MTRSHGTEPGAGSSAADQAPHQVSGPGGTRLVGATPLVGPGPDAASAAVDARLDAVRDRVARTASTGRAASRQLRRISRDLDRTADDLARLAPGIPPVRVRLLTERLEGYRASLAALSSPAATSSGSARSLVTLAAAGGAVWLTVALHLPFILVAVAVITATSGARAVMRWRRRWVGRRRFAPVSEALGRIDAQLAGDGGTDVRRLDSARHDLVHRARASGRLDARGLAALRGIDGDLDDLLLRLHAHDLGAHASYLVGATVTDYLPDTLEPFLALPPDATVAGRPAAVEVADQLEAMARGLSEARQSPSLAGPQTRLQVQGEFLRDKFTAPS